jgi:hydrogenase maturation protein HypF
LSSSVTFSNSEAGDPVRAAAAAIARGEIVAVKGIGGFHLVCDARNPLAVERLRARKGRGEKPLAVMAANTQSIREFVHVC